MPKKKVRPYPANDAELLGLFEEEYPLECKRASIYSNNVIKEIEKNIVAAKDESDLTYVIYWLQLTVYTNFVMDGLADMATGGTRKKSMTTFT